MNRKTERPADALRTAITLRECDVSEHAALRWGRRVLQDPRLDAWRSDGRLPRDLTSAPETVDAIHDARRSLVAVAPSATATEERASWMRKPTREAPGGAFLMVGDDIAIVVARLDGAHWTAITVLVKHHPDSPYTYEQRRERRRRRRDRRQPTDPQTAGHRRSGAAGPRRPPLYDEDDADARS